MTYPYKAVVFDLDGTLADTLRDLAECVNEVLSRHGHPIHPIDAYRHMVGDGIYVLMQRATGGLCDDTQLSIITEEYRGLYAAQCLRYVTAYDGMNETLHELKRRGVRLLVVTNKPDPQAQVIVEALYGKDLFDGVFGHTSDRTTKPDPTLTLHALHTVNISPSDALFVGDSNVDIYTSKNACMHSAGVCWGFRSKEELIQAGADKVLYKSYELLQL